MWDSPYGKSLTPTACVYSLEPSSFCMGTRLGTPFGGHAVTYVIPSISKPVILLTTLYPLSIIITELLILAKSNI